MAEPLARISGIRELIQPQPIVSFTGAEMLGKAAGEIGQLGMSFADSLVRTEGRRIQSQAVEDSLAAAVRRDKEGRLTWRPPEPDGTIPTDMAIAAGRSAYIAQVQSDIASRAREYAEKYRHQPELFRENFSLYVNETIKNNAFAADPKAAEGFRSVVEAESSKIGTETYNGLRVEATATSMKGARYQLGRAIDSRASEYLSLVYNGGAATQRAQDLRTQHKALLDDAVAGGVIPATQRDMTLNEINKKAFVMQGMSRVREVWERTKDKGAALREAWKIQKSFQETVGKIDEEKLTGFMMGMSPTATPEQRYKAIASFVGERMSFEESREFFSAAKQDISANAEVYATIQAEAAKAATRAALKIYTEKGPTEAYAHLRDMAFSNMHTSQADTHLRTALSIGQKIASYEALKTKVTEGEADDFATRVFTETKGNALQTFQELTRRATDYADPRERRVFMDAATKWVQNQAQQQGLERTLTDLQFRGAHQRAYGDEVALIKDYYQAIRDGADPTKLKPPMTIDQLRANADNRFHRDDVEKLVDTHRDEARTTASELRKKGYAATQIEESLKINSAIPPTEENKKNLDSYIQRTFKQYPNGMDPGDAAHHKDLVGILQAGRLVPPRTAALLDASLASGDPTRVGNVVRFWRTLKEQDLGAVMTQFGSTAIGVLGRVERDMGLMDVSTEEQAKRINEIWKAMSSRTGFTEEEEKRSTEILDREAKASGKSLDEQIDSYIRDGIEAKYGWFGDFFSSIAQGRDMDTFRARGLADISPEIRHTYRAALARNLWKTGHNMDMAVKATTAEIFGDASTPGAFGVSDVLTFGNKPKLVYKPIDTTHPDLRGSGLLARGPLMRLKATLGLEPADDRHYAAESFAVQQARVMSAWLGLNEDGSENHSIPKEERDRRMGVFKRNVEGLSSMSPELLAKRIAKPEFWLQQVRDGRIELSYDRTSDGGRPVYTGRWQTEAGNIIDLNAPDGKRARYDLDFAKSPAGQRKKDNEISIANRTWIGRLASDLLDSQFSAMMTPEARKRAGQMVSEFGNWVYPGDRAEERTMKSQGGLANPYSFPSGYYDDYPGDLEWLGHKMQRAMERGVHGLRAADQGAFSDMTKVFKHLPLLRDAISFLNDEVGDRAPGSDKLGVIKSLDEMRAKEGLPTSDKYGSDPKLVREERGATMVEYGDGKRYELPKTTTNFAGERGFQFWNSKTRKDIEEIETLYRRGERRRAPPKK